MTTDCPNCNQSIEYFREMQGQVFDCPSCRHDVYLPPPPSQVKPAVIPPVIQPKITNISRPWFSMVVLLLIGMGFVLHGFTVKTEGAIHQIYSALYTIGGFIIIGISALMSMVAHVANSLWREMQRR